MDFLKNKLGEEMLENVIEKAGLDHETAKQVAHVAEGFLSGGNESQQSSEDGIGGLVGGLMHHNSGSDSSDGSGLLKIAEGLVGGGHQEQQSEGGGNKLMELAGGLLGGKHEQHSQESNKHSGVMGMVESFLDKN